VLVSGQETRLTGIGVARALEQVGIPAPNRRPYAAPERIAGGVWHRFADIFSLAALMYEMLWGRRLNGTGMQAVATLEPLPGGDLTALSLAFSRALAEDPGGRYSRALKFVEGLKNAFPGEGDTATINMSRAFPPSAHVEPPSSEREALDERDALAERHADPEPEILVQPPGTATVVLPVPLARAPVPEPEVDEVAVGPTVVAQPEPPSPRPEPVVPRAAAPIPAPAVAEARAAALPFELGPRRRDRARYVQPENEIETESTDADSEEDPGATPLERPPLSMLERSRSALWPLGLALILGVAIGVGIGFGGGYWTGFRDRVTPPESAPAATTAAAPQAREYTDSAVRPDGDAAKPPPPTAAAAQPSTPRLHPLANRRRAAHRLRVDPAASSCVPHPQARASPSMAATTASHRSPSAISPSACTRFASPAMDTAWRSVASGSRARGRRRPCSSRWNVRGPQSRPA